MKKYLKAILLSLPLSLRKRLAVFVDRQAWLGQGRRYWWSIQLVKDLAQKDINEFHKFLWSRHLAYAAPYEVASRFGAENMARSRILFFSDLKGQLQDLSTSTTGEGVQSVFEVGCSLGYQLRYLETTIFPSASVLEGIDIDDYAVRAGTGYLRTAGSKIKLYSGDMEDLECLLDGKSYDIIFCTGTLMYLNEEKAKRVMRSMLRRSRTMLALAGLAHPDIDNRHLPHSVTRESDGSFIHNLDAMVGEAGGKVLARRWEGDRLVDGHTIYFLFVKQANSTTRQDRYGSRHA